MQHKAHPKLKTHTIDDAEKEEMSQVRYITIGLIAVYSYFLSLINRLRIDSIPKFLKKNTIDDAGKEEMSQVRYITIGLMAVYSYFLSLINRLRMDSIICCMHLKLMSG